MDSVKNEIYYASEKPLARYFTAKIKWRVDSVDAAWLCKTQEVMLIE